MVTEENALYEGRQHGFSLALATMYLTRAQRAEVYEMYDVTLANGDFASEAITSALRVAGSYDARCQGCNVLLGEEVNALCGSCLLHHGGILEFFEQDPDKYDVDYMKQRVDLPWAWLQNDD
jgi:hypothetical protein